MALGCGRGGGFGLNDAEVTDAQLKVNYTGYMIGAATTLAAMGI